MTERIDHVTKALKIMREVSTDERGEIPLELFDSHEQWIYDATTREAHVHATLALVEQQRIANLTAYLEIAETRRKGSLHFDRGVAGLDAEIREALGLS